MRLVESSWKVESVRAPGLPYKTVCRRKGVCHRFAEKTGELPRPWGTIQGARQVQGEKAMSKILSTAIIVGLLFGVTSPVFAADPPKTKAECEKMTDMKWDAAKKACVKK
jgi:hypothetical protein